MASRIILVRKIPFSVGDFELKNFFSRFGEVKRASVVFDKKTGRHRKFGYVHYDTPEQAETAFRTPSLFLDGSYMQVNKKFGE